jgi:glycosyltransferase involved in cell wall biosynthesis
VDNRRFQEASALAEAEAATWKASLGLPADALVVLFAGKLEIQKRPMDLLEAFLEAHDALLVADSPAPVLLFVGSGAWEERLRARSGDRTGRTVFFAPFQNQSRMPCVYAAADVLVLPSESETWGLSVNEAMNMARPAIVSHAVGCGPDLIRQDQTGWIFTAGDVPGLASTLARALTPGREALRRAGKAGRTVVSGYSFEAAAAVLLAALSTLPSPDRSFEEQRHED